jgi:hypothetical protein
MSFNIGRRMVEYVLETSDLQSFLNERLDADWVDERDAFTFASVFDQDIDVQAYQYLLRYHAQHSIAPTRELFDKNFPVYYTEPTDYSAEELIAEARKAITSAITAYYLDEANELDRQGRAEEALELMGRAAGVFDINVATFEHERAVQNQVRKLSQAREAATRVEASSMLRQPVKYYNGPQIAGLPVTQDWRIRDLIATGANIMLNAQAKSGKSTMVINILHSLVTGEDFLGVMEVQKARKITVVDFEMPVSTSKRWLREAGVLGYTEVEYAFLTGRAGDFFVDNEKTRSELAQGLRGTEVLIIDPLGPLLAAHGFDENSNSDMRRILSGLAALKAEANIGELIVVHHAGHAAANRARGASVLGDWPDAMLNILLPKEEGGKRSLHARGRDVAGVWDMNYDKVTHRLTHTHADIAAREDTLTARIMSVLAAGRMNKNSLVSQLGGNRKVVLDAINTMVIRGKLVLSVEGKRHFVSLPPSIGSVKTVPEPSQNQFQN